MWFFISMRTFHQNSSSDFNSGLFLCVAKVRECLSPVIFGRNSCLRRLKMKRRKKLLQNHFSISHIFSLHLHVLFVRLNARVWVRLWSIILSESKTCRANECRFDCWIFKCDIHSSVFNSNETGKLMCFSSIHTLISFQWSFRCATQQNVFLHVGHFVVRRVDKAIGSELNKGKMVVRVCVDAQF